MNENHSFDVRDTDKTFCLIHRTRHAHIAERFRKVPYTPTITEKQAYCYNQHQTFREAYLALLPLYMAAKGDEREKLGIKLDEISENGTQAFKDLLAACGKAKPC